MDEADWLSSVGHRPSAIGHRPSAIGHRPSAIDAELWLSPISVWDSLVLIERGREKVDGPAAELVDEALAAVPLREAPLTHRVALESRRLRLPILPAGYWQRPRASTTSPW